MMKFPAIPQFFAQFAEFTTFLELDGPILFGFQFEFEKLQRLGFEIWYLFCIQAEFGFEKLQGFEFALNKINHYEFGFKCGKYGFAHL